MLSSLLTSFKGLTRCCVCFYMFVSPEVFNLFAIGRALGDEAMQHNYQDNIKAWGKVELISVHRYPNYLSTIVPAISMTIKESKRWKQKLADFTQSRNFDFTCIKNNKVRLVIRVQRNAASGHSSHKGGSFSEFRIRTMKTQHSYSCVWWVRIYT